MQKIVNHEANLQYKKVGNVPSFIRERSVCKSIDYSKASGSRGNFCKEFQLVNLTDARAISKMKSRV